MINIGNCKDCKNWSKREDYFFRKYENKSSGEVLDTFFDMHTHGENESLELISSIPIINTVGECDMYFTTNYPVKKSRVSDENIYDSSYEGSIMVTGKDFGCIKFEAK